MGSAAPATQGLSSLRPRRATRRRQRTAQGISRFAKSLMGKVVGDIVGSGSLELEIVAISQASLAGPLHVMRMVSLIGTKCLMAVDVHLLDVPILLDN
jgi:hypothetical protein